MASVRPQLTPRSPHSLLTASAADPRDAAGKAPAPGRKAGHQAGSMAAAPRSTGHRSCSRSHSSPQPRQRCGLCPALAPCAGARAARGEGARLHGWHGGPGIWRLCKAPAGESSCTLPLLRSFCVPEISSSPGQLHGRVLGLAGASN